MKWKYIINIKAMKKEIILIITFFVTMIISGCLPTKYTVPENTGATTPTSSISDTENSISDDIVSGDEVTIPADPVLQGNTAGEETISDETLSNTNNYHNTDNTQSASSTDELVNRLTDYAKSGEFDDDGVDLLYEIIDTLSE